MSEAASVVSIDEARRRKVLVNARLTDLGNGERMAAMHGDVARYVPLAKKWYVWDGKRFERDDALHIQRLAKSTVRAMLREAAEMDPDKRPPFLKHATASESSARIDSMIRRCAAEPGIAVAPEAFDANGMILNVANGVVDLRTGALRPHDRALLCTKLVPVEYPEREAAECPTWLAFLDQTQNGDEEMISYIKRAVGYSLTGDTSEQCLHLMVGPGANGKSTFLNVLAEITGDYGMQADFSTFLEKKQDGGPRNDVAHLAGARFVRSSEIGEGKRFNESLIKGLTGGEKMRARFLYAEEFEYTPQFKLWLSANHKPVVRGNDYAIWRRLRLIPFTVTISPEQRDPLLFEKLRAELPGILRWAVDGCLEWLRDGLKPPASVLAATDSFRQESDTLGAFVDDCCEVGNGLQTQASDLYKEYKRWAEAGGEYVMSNTAFGRRLEERGYPVVKRGGLKYRQGLQLAGSSTGGMF